MSRRSPGGGHGNSLTFPFLENPMDRGAWKATVYRVPKSQTQLKWLSTDTRPEYISNFCNSVAKNDLIKKWGEDLRRYFSKKIYTNNQKVPEKVLSITFCREMQTKSTRYHLTRIRVAAKNKQKQHPTKKSPQIQRKKQEYNEYGWESREIRCLVHCWWECKMV